MRKSKVIGFMVGPSIDGYLVDKNPGFLPRAPVPGRTKAGIDNMYFCRPSLSLRTGLNKVLDARLLVSLELSHHYSAHPA
jgi:hypothetical protein